jgi:hypothetical protein
MFVCINLKFHKEIKKFLYSKALLEKPFYYYLKGSIEKTRFQNTILFLLKSYASTLAKDIFYKMIYIK